ncbi:MAG: LytTR family DNA-binding domain-containing protein [Gemmatimonadaceae bacterium]
MTPRLSVLVADDEPLARQALVDIVAALPGWDVVAAVGDGRAACEQLRTGAIDVALLDIEMPAPNGLEVARWASREGIDVAVVFVTSHSEHAVRAFDVHALDYVLKPLRPARVEESLRRALERRSQTHLREALAGLQLTPEPRTRWLQHITATTNGRTRVIAVSQVVALATEDNYVRVYADGTSTLVRGALAALLARLDPQRFVRTHRCAVVNIDAVVAFKTRPNGDYVVKLRTGITMPVSRGYRDAFLERFK